MPSAASRAIAYVFVAIIMLTGPVLLTGAAVAAVRQAIFLRTCTAADGVIIELRRVPGRRGSSSYAPVFRFTADDGLTYTLGSNTATNPPSFKAGEHVKVLYQHGDPIHAKIDSFMQLWLSELIVGGVGGAFSVIPVLVIVRRQKKISA